MINNTRSEFGTHTGATIRFVLALASYAILIQLPVMVWSFWISVIALACHTVVIVSLLPLCLRGSNLQRLISGALILPSVILIVCSVGGALR